MKRSEIHGLMGTVADLRIWAKTHKAAEMAAGVVLSEIRRLEAVFNVFDAESELCRWRRNEAIHPSIEFADVMGSALHWHERSAGLFNPFIDLLSTRWRQAEIDNVTPPSGRMRSIADSISDLPFEIRDGQPIAVGDCSALNLNAIAKGYIVDVSSASGFESDEVSALMLNVGGDIRVLGEPPTEVGIENPLRPFDNEPPLITVPLTGGALATSGGSRRGFRVGDRWCSHVIDPRSGQTATGAASISVVADSAMESDVVATAASVLSPSEARSWVSTLDGIDAFIVEDDGAIRVTPGWVDRFGEPQPGSAPRQG